MRKRETSGFCFALLLTLGVVFFFASTPQAAPIVGLPSVPIIIYDQAGGPSSWTISNFASDTYVLGYDSTTLLTGSGLTTPSFENGVYDFWLDTNNDNTPDVSLSNGDALLTFQGVEFSVGATTYYSDFIINWNVSAGSYDFTFSSSTQTNAGATPVPPPTTLLLLGSGLLGLVVLRRRTTSS